MKNLFTLLIVAAISLTAIGQTVKIGSVDYSTIQEALDAADPGAVIDITGIHTETLVIKKGVTLKGTDPSVDVIRAAALPSEATMRVVYINGAVFPEAANVTIENLSILNGVSGKNMGGGIFIDKVVGDTKLENLIISNNQADHRGGGVAVAGSNVDVNYCTISENNSLGVNGFGGGFFIAPNNNTHNAIVNINNSLITNNTCNVNGAAFFVDGNQGYGNTKYIDVNFNNSIIAFNTAPNGIGAVFVKGAKHPTDNVGNVRAQFHNVAMAYNQAKSGEVNGLRFFAAAGMFPQFSMYNSIISLNGADDDNDVSFNTTITTDVVNCLIGKAFGLDDLVTNSTGTEVGKFADELQLADELIDKGSKTLVLPIGATSEAVDFGDAATATESDIRGKARTEGLAPDVGAYEFVQPTAINLSAEKNTITLNEELNLMVDYTPLDADAVPLVWEMTPAAGGQLINSVFSSENVGEYSIKISTTAPYALSSNELEISVTLTTDIVDSKSNTISIYPNPASGDILSLVGVSKAESVEIYNLQGKLIKKADNALSINISGLLSGSYIVVVKTGNESFITKFLRN